MAFLTPDKTYDLHGLTVKEKLITAGSGVRYYSNRRLDTIGHKPEYITIHNTPDINEAAGTNDAEQYARATFNNNMGDVVVHYYIDETDCWHILADDTVGWHAADGVNGPGNTKSVAVEIIMDGSGRSHDVKAEERGALLAAILLRRYGLGVDRLKTHRDWYPKKYCPAYILPHWDAFVGKVKSYLADIEKQDAAAKAPRTDGAKKKTFYRVQVGYFGVYENAAAMKKLLNDAGFDAIIKEETV
ncbi:MAG: N-acetylmuramoyl-L-alanine amidase [Clostridia bacterium]|nr:N-acetylmuramoyl-L-alanine amidase [Clostridia bacterium]